jgi:hypothetical protein
MNFRLALDTRYCGEPFYSRTGDLLRIPEKYQNYRYANISQIFNGFKNLRLVGATTGFINAKTVKLHDKDLKPD